MCKILRLRNKNIGDMTKFSELPEQPSYILKTHRVRAKILNMKLLLVSVYQVCLNRSPSMKIDTTPGVLFSLYVYSKKLKNLFQNFLGSTELKIEKNTLNILC
jgi:hypothetical protein